MREKISSAWVNTRGKPFLICKKKSFHFQLTHVLIQEFSSGGGPGQSDKKSSDNVFFFFVLRGGGGMDPWTPCLSPLDPHL